MQNACPNLHPQVKWVNDIIVGGKKISGVLAIAENEGGNCYMHLGMGVNINCNPMADASTSLKIEMGAQEDLDLRPLVTDLANNLVSNSR